MTDNHHAQGLRSVIQDLKPRDWFDWLCLSLILLVVVPMTLLNVIVWYSVLTQSPYTEKDFENCLDESVTLGKAMNGDPLVDKVLDKQFHNDCDKIIAWHQNVEWNKNK